MKKLLIVDDSLFIRKYLIDLLNYQITVNKLTSIEIFEASSMLMALKKIKNIKPDIIMVDIVMKGSNQEGLELLNNIKTKFNMNNIIVISAVRQERIVEKCRKIGVKHYFQKPFSHPQLTQTVNEMVSI